MSGPCNKHEDIRSAYNISENVKKKNHLGDLIRDGKIIWILHNTALRVWTNSSGSGYSPVVGSCERGTEPSIP
jgi:hypothetical protein